MHIVRLFYVESFVKWRISISKLDTKIVKVIFENEQNVVINITNSIPAESDRNHREAQNIPLAVQRAGRGTLHQKTGNPNQRPPG